jgi:predicted nucleic acid-binding protein
METTYLIDTNILVYAYNEDVEFHEEALRILENALNKTINAAIADKSLFEFFAIITDSRRVENPITVDEAIEIINFLVDSNIKIVYSSPFSFLKTLELIKKYKIKKQEIFDINLVALMIQNKIDTIITADDKHFKNRKEINVINPFKQQTKKETENIPEGLGNKAKNEEIPGPEKKDKKK